MKYRSDIDGLRCIAVLPVVLFHAGVVGFSGGFVGVDIFFVISGFLITSIIDDDLRKGNFSLGRFYERRFRRIIPALIFVVLLTTFASWMIFLPSFLEDYSKSLIAVGTFTSNIYFWKYSGYFENSAHLRPLLHTWSLAVEEQFYIAMPLAMSILYRLARRWRLVFFSTAAVLSFALSIYATSVAPTANFFLLPTRSWELLMGSLLAFARTQNRLGSAANSLTGGAGLALVAGSVFLSTEATPFPGLAALVPCLGAMLVIFSGEAERSIVARFLSRRPIVFIGQISYSLYLVHWPVTVFLRYIVALSTAIAVFSWRYVEQPFRSRELGWSKTATIATSLSVMTAVACVGYFGVLRAGFPGRFPDYEASIHARTQDASALVVAGGQALKNGQSWRNGTCFFEDDNTFENWKAENCLLAANGGSKAMLWGDSFAAHYAPGIIGDASEVDGTLYQYTQAGCPPVLAYYSYARPRCQDFNSKALQLIKKLNIQTVILSGRWVDLQLRGLDLLQGTTDKLKAENVRVIVIGQSPMFVTDVDVIAYRKTLPSDISASWKTVIRPDLNIQLKQVTEGAEFIDPISVDCSNGVCPYMDAGRLLYFDSGHLSNFGSERLTRRIIPLFGHFRSS